MSFSELFFLSLLQGITEFLPISSSAHLILYAEYFGSSKQGITVDVFAHFGTLIAVLIYFRKDLEVIFVSADFEDDIEEVVKPIKPVKPVLSDYTEDVM